MGALAEATMPGDKRWIPKGMDVTYTAKATSDITCIAETDAEQWTSDDPDLPVRVRGVRDDGTVVIEGVIRLWVTPEVTCRRAAPVSGVAGRPVSASVMPEHRRLERLLLADVLALHPGREPGQEQVDHDVDRGHHEGRLHLVLELGVDLLADVGQAGRTDREPQAGVLERHHALADDRGQHDLDGLRQQHDVHDLGLAHAQRVRRLGLPVRNRRDAGPEHLGQHGAVVDGQRDHHAPVGPDAAVARRRRRSTGSTSSAARARPGRTRRPASSASAATGARTASRRRTGGRRRPRRGWRAPPSAASSAGRRPGAPGRTRE